MRKGRLGLLLLMLVACKSTTAPEAASQQAVTSDRALVIVATEVRGYIAPCGCTSNPLGGVAKLAQLVEDKRRTHGDPLLVTAGNFLFETAGSKPTTAEQDETRARLLAEVYKDLGVAAQVPGTFDQMHADGAFLRGITNPWLGENGAVVEKRAGGLHIAFVAITAPPPPELAAKLQDLRARVDALVALSSLGWQASRDVAQKLPVLDVVVASGGGEPHSPSRVGQTEVVDAGEQGQHVGLLELVRGEESADKRWKYYDAGALELSQLQRQLRALEQQIAEQTSDAKVREMRLNMRDELAKQIADLQNKPPPAPMQRYVRYSLVALTKKLPDNAAVVAKVKAYNATLCDSSKRATAGLECEKAAPGAPSYVGNASCGNCHPQALAQWRTTKHARAVETLQDAGKLCDLGCIGCHTTGFNAPGGFCSPQKIGAFADVGCEMCHGPGSQHAETTKVVAPFVKSPSEVTCAQCHTKEHSDLFDFAKYRPRILGPGHGAK